MRPLKLVMSAFGPYKDVVEIDFEKLGNQGVFLITGDTGSGKTTIFDAISFALFGVSSGSRRENGSFRSDFANSDVSTFVRLTFIHKGILYQLERIPRYMRNKKKGEGMTAVGGEATLTYLDEIITGDKNVTDKCVGILGMNANQFKQIVMIAQGEFLELLLAKPKDRATIFRHIFDTGIFKDISDRLKDNYLSKKREYEDSTLSINGYIESVQLNNGLNGNESTDEILSLLSEEIKQDLHLEGDIEKEKVLLGKHSTSLIQSISEGKFLNDSIVSLEECKELLSSLLKEEKSYLEKEEIVKKNKDIWDKVEPYRLEVLRLEKELKLKNERLAEETSLYNKILVQYNENLKLYEGLDKKQVEIKKYEKLIEEAKEKLDLFEEVTKLNCELDELEQCYFYFRLEELKKIWSDFKECDKKVKELDDLKVKLLNNKDIYVLENKKYLEQYDLFLSAQAGILASDLKEGEACPVCGSVTHPSLAKMVDEVLSKEELDSIKKKLDETFIELENFRNEIIEKEKELGILKNQLSEIDLTNLKKEIAILEKKSLRDVKNIKIKSIKELEVKIESLKISLLEKKENLGLEFDKEQLLVDLVKYKEIVDKIEKEIDQTQKKYDKETKEKIKLESSIEVLKKDILELDTSFKLANKKYIESYQQLGYQEETEYMTVKLDKESFSLLEKSVSDYHNQVLELKGKIATLDKVVAGRDIVNVVKLEEELENVNKKLNDVELSLKELNSKISNNEKVYDRLKSVSEKTTKLEREVMVYKDLSDTANGMIAGKSKLEFEQFVQASYFDRVLQSANKRFLYMTDERYQLFRKEEAVKISDKLGLELEVMDYYTGKKRDIKSLSGGESFKASLSLALGMSDVIQEFAGGVVVEAMFIDEGFGSLDDESLDQAMNAIMMLGQDNKMIGIISHVNELKARIDKKIVVKKSSSGSDVSILV